MKRHATLRWAVCILRHTDVPTLVEIIKRPVAMESNLHNAIFSPETLEMWFADAGKDAPACDEPYARCKLDELMRFYEMNMAARSASREAGKGRRGNIE